MEISGRIKKIFEEQTFPSGFRKKEIVVTTQEQYPQDVLIEFLQDKVSLIEPLSEGDEIRISINIRGREWINPEGVAKYFNSISGWRVEKIGAGTEAPEEYTNIPPIAPTIPSQDDSGVDDLPF
ncbi:MAG: DUF3127 domain-containing protein [Weeksellaceae bacterium]|jgi:translation initiation factor IF-3|nr:DUF3127 domain-containing protein [Weeksellaceae bacterium]MDX9704425.1 DUF3127 domain-containing protein [Weeksellaceae bacterium]